MGGCLPPLLYRTVPVRGSCRPRYFPYGYAGVLRNRFVSSVWLLGGPLLELGLPSRSMLCCLGCQLGL